MFDIAPTELLLCAVVALVVIGPKDLPKAMRTVGQFVAKVRGIGRHFRSGFDEMVREAELKEMEETWAKENARIMREHPPGEVHDAEFARGDVAGSPSVALAAPPATHLPLTPDMPAASSATPADAPVSLPVSGEPPATAPMPVEHPQVGRS